MRRKVLMVTRNFPPLTGGMERLNYQVFQALREAFDVALCGPVRCMQHTTNGIFCREFSPVPPWRYVAGSTWNSTAMARTWRPDLVFAGSGLAAPAAWLAGKIAHAPVAVYLHGLDIVASNPIYQSLFLPTIRKCNAFFANSRNTVRLAVASKIPFENLAIIHPGVTVPDFSQHNTQRTVFRKHFQLHERPVLLAVGRITPRKGLMEFIELCLPEIIAARPETCLLIIGAIPVEPLSKIAASSAAGLLKDIKAAITRLSLQNHVYLLGKTDDATLSAAYFAADILIFPVIDLPGDVEGFGMVAVEAAAHGLPTVGFAAGGVADAVEEGVSGYLTQPRKYAELTKSILRHLSGDRVCNPDSCRQFAERFTWDRFGEGMRQHCSRILERR